MATRMIRARFAVSNLRAVKVRDAYSKSVMGKVSQDWNPAADGERKWAVFKDCLVKSAYMLYIFVSPLGARSKAPRVLQLR